MTSLSVRTYASAETGSLYRSQLPFACPFRIRVSAYPVCLPSGNGDEETNLLLLCLASVEEEEEEDAMPNGTAPTAPVVQLQVTPFALNLFYVRAHHVRVQLEFISIDPSPSLCYLVRHVERTIRTAGAISVSLRSIQTSISYSCNALVKVCPSMDTVDQTRC
ncbi:hypothetical protein M514_23077 [Trichuris suis]|uniref:Uncharacterized protein n=1 Tax=Trichuris suis TaxID=68888 RepID=A0A085N5K8_9BILA|nr:hypothetical protein M514_23077 [Trichuris suis]